MKINNNILDLIGKTPLVRLDKLNPNDNDVIVKVESFNPGGSIKDRVGLAMIEDAEKKGILNKDTIIIEPTSGNTGVGLAMAAAVKGYKLILTMPDTMSMERQSLLKAYGAEIVLTPGSKGMKGAIDKVDELIKEFPDSFVPMQFQNKANPQIHSETTALEIINDTSGDIDIFVAGVGTGGTLTGVGKVLKKRIPSIKIVAIEPHNSAVISGQSAGPHKVQGIGAGFIPGVLDTSLIDEIIKVKDNAAFDTMVKLAREEGILAGISSGAAVSAALQLASRPENKGKKILTVLPDTGERYLSLNLF